MVISLDSPVKRGPWLGIGWFGTSLNGHDVVLGSATSGAKILMKTIAPEIVRHRGVGGSFVLPWRRHLWEGLVKEPSLPLFLCFLMSKPKLRAGGCLPCSPSPQGINQGQDTLRYILVYCPGKRNRLSRIVKHNLSGRLGLPFRSHR